MEVCFDMYVFVYHIQVLCVDIETADGRRMTCKLLDCYTITQAKIKMMDQLYRGIGFLQRPKLNVS